MSNCPICYQDFNINKLVSPGCCSVKICKECIMKCDKCPQCKESFFWSQSKTNNWELEYIIYNLRYDLQLARDDIIQLSKLVKDKQKIINNNKSVIDELHHQIANTSKFDSVILRYHLNII